MFDSYRDLFLMVKIMLIPCFFKDLDPLIPKVSYQFGEFGIRLINNPLIDILLYSHHFYAWYCIDIVRRNSLLVTHVSSFVSLQGA